MLARARPSQETGPVIAARSNRYIKMKRRLLPWSKLQKYIDKLNS